MFQIWIAYILFKPVSHRLALLFVLLNIANVWIEAISKIFLLMVLPIMHSRGLPDAFGRPQMFELVALALKAHNIGFIISLIFFGPVCLLRDIFRSGFLPKALGLLMQLAGLAYLAQCFSQLFVPAIAEAITSGAFALILLGERVAFLWPVVQGRERRGVALER